MSLTYFRYLAVRLTVSHLIVVAIFVVAFTIKEQAVYVADGSRIFADIAYNLRKAASKLPGVLLQLYPALVAVSSTAALIFPALKGEFVALESAGAHPFRTALGPILLALSLHGATILTVSHMGQIAAVSWQSFALDKKYGGEPFRSTQLWNSSASGDGYLIVGAAGYSLPDRSLRGVAIVDVDRHFKHPGIRYAEVLLNRDDRWIASGGDFVRPTEIDFRRDYSGVVSGFLDADEVSIFSLADTVSELREAGLETVEYRMAFLKILGSLLYPPIIVLWAFALILRLDGNHRYRYFSGLALKVLLAAATLYMVNRPLTAYSVSGGVPPEAVVYLPHLIVLLSGLLFFRRGYIH